MFADASAAWRNLSAHIGARIATTAATALFAAVSLAVLPNVHPPQPKPMTTVARKPANAPCKRRVRDSRCRIEGNCMGGLLSLDCFEARATDTRDGIRSN